MVEFTNEQYLELSKIVDITIANEYCHLNGEELKKAWLIEYGKSVYARAWLDGHDCAMNENEGALAAIREALSDPSGEANEMVMDWSKVKPEAIKSDPMYQMGYAAAKAEPVKQEPVGMVKSSEEWGVAGVLIAGLPIGTLLYAAPVDAKAIRAEALEEAAKWFEEGGADSGTLANAIAAAIRGLK